MLAKLHASQTILRPALSHAILSDSRCIFAFDSEGGASRALEQICTLGIDASPVKRQV